MPQPGPSIGEQFVFVTNYLLAGCGPQQDLIFELNTDAAKDLLLMFIVPDISDIVKAMFDPRNKRGRSPGRHGRKKRIGRGFPDVSEMIGRRARVTEVAEALQKLPGARYVLPAINVMEGINIAAAVIEGLADTVYDNLAGLLDLNPNYCREFPRFRRQICYGAGCKPPNEFGPYLVGSPGPQYDPIFFNELQGNTGFLQTSGVFNNTTQAWGLAAGVRLMGTESLYGTQGRLCVTTNARGVVAMGPTVRLAPQETIELTINAKIRPNEYATVAWNADNAYALVLGGSVLGYGKSGWLDWAS